MLRRDRASGTEARPLQRAGAGLSPGNANYDIDVDARPGHAHADRQRGHHLAQHGADRGLFHPAAPLLERLPQHGFHLAEAARSWRATTPFAERPADDFGYSEVTALHIAERRGPAGRGPHARAALHPPDDQNPDDRRSPPPTCRRRWRPGETLRLRVAWTGKFPRNFDRTGAIGNYFFVAQWFPKLGVFEAGGWTATSSTPTPSSSPTSALYDVRMTVPAGWVVGATGARALAHRHRRRPHHPPLRAGGRARLRLDDEPRLPRADRSASSTRACRRCDMRLLLQPEHAGQAERHFAATTAALRYYGEWFGAVPLPATSPSSTRRSRAASGGMEYPTLFTAGTRWLAPPGSNEPEGVTIHEAGHQFWYGLVANNEFERRPGSTRASTSSRLARAGGGLPAQLPGASASSAASSRGSSATSR